MSVDDKNKNRSFPRKAIAGLVVLVVAGFLAAIGTAQISHNAGASAIAQSTTGGTTTGTTSTGTTSTSTSTSSTTTSTTPSSSGCPTAASGATVAASDVQPPSRLLVGSFATTPHTISGGFSTFTATVTITDTCGQPVQGANVYVTAVPYRQVSIEQGTTGSDGTVTLTFSRLNAFPAASHQQLMVFFVRATRSGDSLLAGISNRRLISVRVHL
jgi:hypothetical protein